MRQEGSDAGKETAHAPGRHGRWEGDSSCVRKARTLGRRQLMRQEGTNKTRNRDLEEQLRLGSERTTSGIYMKNI
jgi:hypothetical protein